MPTPKALLSRLMAFERAHGLLKGRRHVLAAVSGGPDSVCLLHHLTRVGKHEGFRVTALHLNHGLRAAAAGDARFVERLAPRLGAAFAYEQLPVKKLAQKERRSIEDAARRLRYQAYARWAKSLGASAVATGHQLDDQAETLILHLLRGTQAKGLGGIAPLRVLREAGPKSRIKLIRPLLPLRREEIAAYLDAYGLKARRDASNDEERFTRNWVRKRVLPLLAEKNPKIRENLAALAEDVRRTFLL